MSWRQTIWSVNIFLIAPFKSSNFLCASASLLPLFFFRKWQVRCLLGWTWQVPQALWQWVVWWSWRWGWGRRWAPGQTCWARTPCWAKWCVGSFSLSLFAIPFFRNLPRSFRIEKWKIATNIFLKVTPSLVYIPLPVWPFVGLFLNMYNIIIEEHFSPKFKQWLHVVIKTRMIWLWWSMMARGLKVWRKKMWDLI